jgi:hypothetical protein
MFEVISAELSSQAEKDAEKKSSRTFQNLLHPSFLPFSFLKVIINP